MAVDLPTAALAAACVGCGCGGACYVAPENSIPGPLENVRMAVVQVIDGWRYGSTDYSFGGQTWNDQRGWN